MAMITTAIPALQLNPAAAHPTRTPWVFASALLLIIALKVGHYTDPPYWDAAMSVFPAAITLAESNFDYPALLSAPTFFQGGPNVHANSLLTLLHAIVFKLAPEPSSAFLVLHFIHYTLAAGIIALLYSWAVPLLGRGVAALLALATLFVPVLFTQAGMMYLEIPCTFAAIAALSRFSKGKTVQAALWALMAVAIKEPGIMVAGALSAAALVQPWPPGKRLFTASYIAAPCLALLLGLKGVHTAVGDSYTYIEFLEHAWYYIKAVPDLLVLYAAGMIITVVRLPGLVQSYLRTSQGATNDIDPVSMRRLLIYLMLLMFTAFYLLAPLAGTVYMLPRYYVIVIPMAMLAIADVLRSALGWRLATGFSILSLGFSLVNHSGRFYPNVPGNNGAIAERSAEYADLMAAQRDIMAAAQKLPPTIPIYFGLPELYFSTYPAMGYAKGPFPKGTCFTYERQYSALELKTFPDHFYLLVTATPNLNWVKTQAEADPSYEVTTRAFRHGYFQTRLVEVRKRQPVQQ